MSEREEIFERMIQAVLDSYNSVVEMIDLILETVNNIDLSVYKDSMSPLIKKDIEALMTVVK